METVPYQASHLDALVDFSKTTWRRPHTEPWVDWRYRRCSHQRGMVLIEDGRVLATSFGLARPWWAGGETHTLLETIDWAALPELRGAGVGILPLMSLGRGEHPLFAVGGSDDTNQLIERMGFAPVGAIESFVLPTSSSWLAHKLADQRGLPAASLRLPAAVAMRAWFRPGSGGMPYGGRATEVSEFSNAAVALPRQDRFHAAIALLDRDWLRWLQDEPGRPQFVRMEFHRGGTLAGYGVGRVRRVGGVAEGLILDAYTPSEDPQQWRWMVRELTRRLVGLGAALVRARAASPRLAAALLAQRFRSTATHRLRLKGGEGLMQGPLHVAAASSDQALMPYPSVVETL